MPQADDVLMTTAVILPERESCLAALQEARATAHAPQCRLYSNGKRMAWLPRRLPGWFPFGGSVKLWDEYEQTNRSAGCCDIEEAA